MRDTTLSDRMMGKVRACSRTTCAVFVSTDGWAAYSKSICRACARQSQKDNGKGTMSVARVVRVVYCDGYQTSREETGGESDQKNDARNS